MPLLHGKTKAIIGENVREMMHSGHPQRQAVAAAMRMAGKPKKKRKKQSTLQQGGQEV